MLDSLRLSVWMVVLSAVHADFLLYFQVYALICPPALPAPLSSWLGPPARGCIEVMTADILGLFPNLRENFQSFVTKRDVLPQKDV